MFSLQKERDQPLFKLTDFDRKKDMKQGRGQFNRKLNEVETTDEQEFSLNGEKLTSLHAKLHQEADKIRKWKNQTEFDIKQKDMKLQECSKTVESLRKSVLDLQLDNESLSMNLQEEVGNREEILQSIASVKILCEVLKGQLSKTQNKLSDCEAEKSEIRYLEKEHQQKFELLSKQFKDFQIENHKENERLTDLLHNKTKECEDLQEEIKQKSISSKTQLNQMLDKLDEKDIEIRDIRKEVQKREEKEHIQQKTIDSLKDDLSTTGDRLEESNSKNNKLLTEMNDLQAKKDSLQQELINLGVNLKELQLQKENLHKEIACLTENHTQEVLTLSKSLEDHREHLQIKEKRLRFLETDLERATSEIQKVKCSKDLIIMEKADLASKLSEVEKQKSELSSQLEQNELSLTEMTLNANELHLQLGKKQEDEAALLLQFNGLQQQFDAVQSENHTLSMRIKEMEQHVSLKEDIINDVRKQLQEKISELEFLIHKQSDVEQKSEKQRMDAEITLKEMEKMASELKLSKEKYTKQDKMIIELQTEIKNLDTKRETLEEELKANCSMQNELRKKIGEIQSELDKEREINQSIQNEKLAQEKMVEGKLLSKEKAASDLEMKNKNLRGDLTSKNKQIKEMEKELKGMKSRMTSLAKNLAEKTDELHTRKEDLNSLQEELEREKKECVKTKDRIREMDEITERCIKEKDDMYKKCEHQRLEMTTIMQNYKTDNDKLVTIKEKEIESLKSQMKSKVAELQSEIQRLHNSVDESGHQMENLQKVNGEKETLLSKLEQENIKKSEELKELQKQLENMYIKTTTTSDVQTSPYPYNKKQTSTQRGPPKTPQITDQMGTLSACKTPLCQRTPVVFSTPSSKTPQRSILKSLSSGSNKKRKVVFASKGEDEEGSVSEGSDTFEIMETGDVVSHNTPLILKSPRTKVKSSEPDLKISNDNNSFCAVPLSRTPRGPPVDLDKVKHKKSRNKGKENNNTAKEEEKTFTDVMNTAKDKSSIRKAPQKTGGKFFKTGPENRKSNFHNRQTSWFENDDVFGFALED